MIKYSIVIPVYNAEMYLRKNLELFKEIQRNDIEIVAINDGSTDNSLSIIKDYLNKIPNLVVINQENHGVSFSRNVGIKTVSGKYITFLDCDDSLEMSLFKKMDELYDYDYDLIRYGYYEIYSNRKKVKKEFVKNDTVYNNIQNNSECLSMLFSSNKFNTSCNQMIKTDILRKNNLFYDLSHVYAEDFEFDRQLLFHVKKVCFLKEAYYNYNLSSFGVSRKRNFDVVMKCIKDCIEIQTKSYDLCNDLCPEILPMCIKNITLEIKTAIIRLFYIKKLNLKNLKSILKDIGDNKDIKYLKLKKETNNYKVNKIVNSIVFNEPTYIKLIIFKYLFIIKQNLKKLLIKITSF